MSKFSEQAFEALLGPADKLARAALLMQHVLEKIRDLDEGADEACELADEVLKQVDWVFEEDK